MECINHGTCHVPFILTLTIRQTTASPNCSLHQCQPVHPPAVSACSRIVQALASTACSINYTAPGASISNCKVSSFIFLAGCPAHSTSLVPGVNSFFPFQIATLNFEHILLMLKDGGSIPRDTLNSQDRINQGDIHFCPLLCMLHMQCLSLNSLRTLLTKDMFMHPQSKRPPKLSRMTTILLVFQVDSRHKKITNNVGLLVHRVNSRLYSPSQIPDFIKDIEGDLKVACDALKAGGDPGKRHAYCLFVDNLSGAMSIPTDPPYCLVYPTSYIKGVEPDHFDTRNSPVVTHLHCCVCRTTLQFSNDDPKLHTKYIRSHLILSHGVQYNDRLYPTILQPQNHCGLLIDPTSGEPCPMEVVGDFRAVDPIFKGCYGDSLLYSEADLSQLRQQKVYLPMFQGEIPVPPAPSYQQVREPVVAKQSPHRAAAPDTSVESPKAKHSSSKSGPAWDSGRSFNTSTPKHPDSTSAKKPSCPKESTPDDQAKSPQARSSRKHSHSPSPTSGSAGCK